jgi:hypothetical protein
VRRRREPAHVGTDLGQDHLRRDRADPRNGIQASDRRRQFADVRLDAGLDAGLHGGDVGSGRIDSLQHLRQQESVIGPLRRSRVRS